MLVHLVKPGDSLSAIASEYDVPLPLLASWNGLTPPYPLIEGQALLVLRPSGIYTVQSGDTVAAIAKRFGTDERTLYANNPALCGGCRPLAVGEPLALGFDEPQTVSLMSNAYAYPFAEEATLRGILPTLTYLSPFTYGFTEEGVLIPLDDEALLSTAFSLGTEGLMHLSTLTESGNFSDELASSILRNDEASSRLMTNVLQNIEEKGYSGLDVDFEFLSAKDAPYYAAFLAKARAVLNSAGYPLVVAVAPKTFADQPGRLYEGHNYGRIGDAADFVFLMTYEWGYTYGPPMAVAPLPSVRRVVEYAITEIAPQKLFLGLPNYGYDWSLPYQQGDTRARLIGNEEAIAIARRVGAAIRFDETAQTPYFNYSEGGIAHEVWFEDVRSYRKKLELLPEYGLAGVGIWNAMRPFAQGFLTLQAGYRIET